MSKHGNQITRVTIYAEGRRGQRLELVNGTYRTLGAWCAKEIVPVGIEFDDPVQFLETILEFLKEERAPAGNTTPVLAEAT